jgi:hypothetical protein
MLDLCVISNKFNQFVNCTFTKFLDSVDWDKKYLVKQIYETADRKGLYCPIIEIHSDLIKMTYEGDYGKKLILFVGSSRFEISYTLVGKTYQLKLKDNLLDRFLENCHLSLYNRGYNEFTKIK